MLITTPSLCRICFWRRNEIAPAYCFQHLDLELRSRDDGCRANPADAPLLPRLGLVARFGPEWNSPDDDKNALLQHIRQYVRMTAPVAQVCCIPLLRPHRSDRFRKGDGRSSAWAGSALQRSVCRPMLRPPVLRDDHPVAQPRSDGATAEIEREHHEAEVEPIAEAAGRSRASRLPRPAPPPEPRQPSRHRLLDTPWPR